MSFTTSAVVDLLEGVQLTLTDPSVFNPDVSEVLAILSEPPTYAEISETIVTIRVADRSVERIGRRSHREEITLEVSVLRQLDGNEDFWGPLTTGAISLAEEAASYLRTDGVRSQAFEWSWEREETTTLLDPEGVTQHGVAASQFAVTFTRFL